MSWDKLVIYGLAFVVILHWIGAIDIPDNVVYLIFGVYIFAYWAWKIVG